jgi:hypothetical protein
MDPSTGCVQYVDFGLSHGLDGCPLNLLSLPLLFQAGSIAHFEPGNCYFQVSPGSARIPFEYSPEDMFHIKAALPGDQPAQACTAIHAAGPYFDSSAPGNQSVQACTANHTAGSFFDSSAHAVPDSSADGFDSSAPGNQSVQACTANNTAGSFFDSSAQAVPVSSAEGFFLPLLLP